MLLNTVKSREYIKKDIDESFDTHDWVYILIINSKSRFAQVIKSFTKSPYNHTSISFDKNLTNMYSININGMLVENLKETYIPEAEFSLYRMKVKKHNISKMKANIKHYMDNKDDYSYNWLGLGGILLNRDVNRENRFFCSEFIAHLFEKSDEKVFEKPSSLVKPYDFAKNKRFEFVYRGKVKNFHPSRIKK